MTAARLTIISIVLLGTQRAIACEVPVFRYALNNWQLDEYELRANGLKLPPDMMANLTIKPGDGGASKLLAGEREIWSGPLASDTLAMLLDSPVRRQIIQHLLAGDSVVWALVESGDAAADDATAKALSERLRYLESIAVVPEMDPNDPFNQIGPGPALAIRYSIVRLSRKDPREAMTLALLDRNHADASAPVAFPIFGRGRVLIGLPQKDLTQDHIDEVCQFLTGECSCRIKDNRIGWDLLVQCDWDEELALAEQVRRRGPQSPQAKSPTVSQSALTPETVTIEAQASIVPQRHSLSRRSEEHTSELQ